MQIRKFAFKTHRLDRVYSTSKFAGLKLAIFDILATVGHQCHLEKEKGDIACSPKEHDHTVTLTVCWNTSITTRPTDLNFVFKFKIKLQS